MYANKVICIYCEFVTHNCNDKDHPIFANLSLQSKEDSHNLSLGYLILKLFSLKPLS